MHSVLFICTANICRSPLAMGLLQAKVQSANESDWEIQSAGVWATPGHSIASNADLLLRNQGIDLSQHESQPVSKEILKAANLVLTMENGQKEGLKIAFPEEANKIYLITEMIDQSYDIRDPYGRTLADFKATAKEIHKIINIGFERIKQLSSD